jgi:hypothetical protein
MDPTHRATLERLHGYGEWAGRSTLAPGRTLRGFTFAGDELPGLQVERVDRRGELNPPRLTAFWRRGKTGGVVRTDLFDCGSLQAAHAYLIDVLDEFESAAIGRRADAGFGDVAFGTDSVALFARANLVVLVRKATPQSEAVAPIAKAIDALILGRLQ